MGETQRCLWTICPLFSPILHLIYIYSFSGFSRFVQCAMWKTLLKIQLSKTYTHIFVHIFPALKFYLGSYLFSISMHSFDGFVVKNKLNKFNHVHFIIHIVIFRLQYDSRVCPNKTTKIKYFRRNTDYAAQLKELVRWTWIKSQFQSEIIGYKCHKKWNFKPKTQNSHLLLFIQLICAHAINYFSFCSKYD